MTEQGFKFDTQNLGEREHLQSKLKITAQKLNYWFTKFDIRSGFMNLSKVQPTEVRP